MSNDVILKLIENELDKFHIFLAEQTKKLSILEEEVVYAREGVDRLKKYEEDLMEGAEMLRDKAGPSE